MHDASSAHDLTVDPEDVARAAARLAPWARRTPVRTSGAVDRLIAARVHLKCENLQRGGAFKFRGAMNALLQLADAERARGVLTWSSGNHAQAVAKGGALLGIPVTVVMPDDAPAPKLAATRSYGARVVLYDPRAARREELGRAIAVEQGLAIIPPYDHPHIVAGQGTAARELLEETGPLDALLVPCGGGGLLAGSALAARDLAPGCRVIGVEPALADDATRSFRTGVLHTVSNPPTVADGARTPSLGAVNFPIIRRCVDEMVTVSDEAILRAMRFLWERTKLVVEPTGALAFAALYAGAVALPGRRVGVILSGGNVDVAALAPLLAALPGE